MRNSTNVTVTGWVANEPRSQTSESGVDYVSFRMGSTPRYFDRSEKAWTDGQTEWFTVKAWREAARNIALSIRKSQPVVVHGRLVTSEWQSDSGPRKDLVIEAFAVGHDLTHGNAVFKRSTVASGTSSVEEQDDLQADADDIVDALVASSSVDDSGLTTGADRVVGLAAEPIPA